MKRRSKSAPSLFALTLSPLGFELQNKGFAFRSDALGVCFNNAAKAIEQRGKCRGPFISAAEIDGVATINGPRIRDLAYVRMLATEDLRG